MSGRNNRRGAGHKKPAPSDRRPEIEEETNKHGNVIDYGPQFGEEEQE